MVGLGLVQLLQISFVDFPINNLSTQNGRLPNAMLLLLNGARVSSANCRYVTENYCSQFGDMCRPICWGGAQTPPLSVTACF